MPPSGATFVEKQRPPLDKGGLQGGFGHNSQPGVGYRSVNPTRFPQLLSDLVWHRLRGWRRAFRRTTSPTKLMGALERRNPTYGISRAAPALGQLEFAQAGRNRHARCSDSGE